MTLQFENNFCNSTNTCSSRRTLGEITRKTKQNSWKFCVCSYKVGTHIMGASASSETFCYILWIKLFASKMIKHSEARFPICTKGELHVHGIPCWNPPTSPYSIFWLAQNLSSKPRAETRPPPPITLFLVVQNLSSKQIVPTDNMQPVRQCQMASSMVKGLRTLPLESGSLVSLLLRIIGVQTSLAVAMWVYSWRTGTEHTCKYMHKQIGISGAQELRSSITSCPYSDVTPPAVLPTLVPSHRNSKSVKVSWLSKCIHSQNVDAAILSKPCSYYGSASFCSRMAISEHLISKNFPEEHAPRPLYTLHQPICCG